MLSSVFLAIGDVFSAKSVNTLFKALFFTVLSYVLAFSLAYIILLNVNLLSILWLDRILDAAGVLLTIVLGIFLLPSVLAVFSEFFAEDVIDNTESKLFTEPPAKKEISFTDYLFISLKIGVKSLFFTICLGLLSLLFLPLISVTLTPFAAFIICPTVYWIANGFVLAQGYYETISSRILSIMDAEQLWDNYKRGFIFIGAFSCFLYTIPILNIITPVYSYSLMTRYFWKSHNKND